MPDQPEGVPSDPSRDQPTGPGEAADIDAALAQVESLVDNLTTEVGVEPGEASSAKTGSAPSPGPEKSASPPPAAASPTTTADDSATDIDAQLAALDEKLAGLSNARGTDGAAPSDAGPTPPGLTPDSPGPGGSEAGPGELDVPVVDLSSGNQAGAATVTVEDETLADQELAEVLSSSGGVGDAVPQPSDAADAPGEPAGPRNRAAARVIGLLFGPLYRRFVRRSGDASHGPRLGATVRCLLVIGVVPFRLAARSMLEGFTGLLVLIDKPFAGLNPGLKNILGYLGLATLVTAAIAWVIGTLWIP